MIRIFDITRKDLLQLARDRNSFLFLLIMPVLFTLLFGFAFGGFGGDDESDSRLPVGLLDQDSSCLSREIGAMLEDSAVIRLQRFGAASTGDLETWVADGDLAGAIIIPKGYGKNNLSEKSTQLVLFADTDTTAGMTIEAEALALTNRLGSAIQTALVLERVLGDRVPFDYAFDQALSAWDDPPIKVVETTSTIIPHTEEDGMSMAHTSPGFMLQFAIAGLLAAAQIIVTERKSHALQRLMTTRVRRVHILVGHYLAILTMIFMQFILLILFAQLFLGVNYFRDPGATLLVAFTAALCIAALGLLIGVLAKNEDQAATFSIVPMFVLAGLGGAWVPLEVTGETFSAIGHISPVAWAMDGFKNITIRGLGVESVLLPAIALLGYALFFFVLAAWRLQVSER